LDNARTLADQKKWFEAFSQSSYAHMDKDRLRTDVGLPASQLFACYDMVLTRGFYLHMSAAPALVTGFVRAIAGTKMARDSLVQWSLKVLETWRTANAQVAEAKDLLAEKGVARTRFVWQALDYFTA